MPRIRYSEAVRQRAVRLVRESHMPITHVAKKIGCSVNTIHLWLKDHKPNSKSDHCETISQEEVATFIPVKLIDQKSPSVEIVTPNGFTLKFSETHQRFITELLSELASC